MANSALGFIKNVSSPTSEFVDEFYKLTGINLRDKKYHNQDLMFITKTFALDTDRVNDYLKSKGFKGDGVEKSMFQHIWETYGEKAGSMFLKLTNMDYE